MLRQAHVELVSIAPMLLHNKQELANPLSPICLAQRAITKKPSSQRTEDDWWELFRLEWLGGLYLDQKGLIFLPNMFIRGALRAGGKVQRNGGAIHKGVLVSDTKFVYPGPREPDKLWAVAPRNQNPFVFVTQARIKGAHGGLVMRARPRFAEWSVSFNVKLAPAYADEAMVESALHDCCGLGDWPEDFGQYQVKSIVWKSK